MSDLDLLFETPLAEVEEYRFSLINKGIYKFIVDDITMEDGSSENKDTGEEEEYRRINFQCKIIEVVTCKGATPSDNLDKMVTKAFFIRQSADPKKTGLGMLKAFLVDITGAQLESSIMEVIPKILNKIFRAEISHRKSGDNVYAQIKNGSIVALSE